MESGELMPKKQLDDTTLEAIAEIICGSGQGAGGGAAYGSLGPYRSKSEIHSFFNRATVEPKGQSSTRKWFVLESLQSLNVEPTGDLLPTSLEKVLLRLASPEEYRGDSATTRSVIDYLNNILQVEGMEIVLSGIEPELRQKSPGITPIKPIKAQRIEAPDFSRLVLDPSLARILTSWRSTNGKVLSVREREWIYDILRLQRSSV
jgi:hypothetical protein